MQDFTNCMLEFLKQEKQRQEDLKQQQKQSQEDIKQHQKWQDDLKRLHESIEWHEERFEKLLKCLTDENVPGNLDIFLQESINKCSRRIYLQKKWYSRHISEVTNQIFKKTVKNVPMRKKVRLFLGKLGASKHEKYENIFLPRQPGQVTFWETIQIEIKIFEEQISLFDTRWQCLNLTKKGLWRLHNFLQDSK